MRAGERDGVDYYFISKSDFQAKLKAGGFVEYNEYNGNFYGTERAELERREAAHPLVFSQAEVHGKQSLDRLSIPHISVFLLPESMEVLRGRLEKRGGMTEADIQQRLAIAKEEIAASESYDLRIVNKEGFMESAVGEIAAYIDKKLALG
jgi:guanylate kinase